MNCTALLVMMSLVGQCEQHREGKVVLDTTSQVFTQQFDKLLEAGGAEYVERRAALANIPGVRSLLKSIVDDKKRSSEARWLAEILIVRIENPIEFATCERLFCEQAAIQRRVEEIHQRPGVFHFDPVILPDRAGEIAERVDREFNRRQVEGARIQARKEEYRRHLEQKVLPDSKCWRHFAGEVAIKGWFLSEELPSGEIMSLERQLNVPGAISFLQWQREGPPDVFAVPVLCHGLYWRSVVHMLGPFGMWDERVKPRLVEFVQDQRGPAYVRYDAIYNLAAFSDPQAIDVLMSVALDKTDLESLRYDALRAAIHLGGRPVLNQVYVRIDKDPEVRIGLRRLAELDSQTNFAENGKVELFDPPRQLPHRPLSK